MYPASFASTRSGFRSSAMVMVFTVFLVFPLSGCKKEEPPPPPPVQQPDPVESDPVEAVPAEPEVAEVPTLESVPPLDRWKDPLADSYKDVLAGKSPTEAADTILQELVQSAEEFTNVVGSMEPNLAVYTQNYSKLIAAQRKVRVLAETARYLATLLPEEEQDDWRSDARSKVAEPLNNARTALFSKSMIRAASEMSAIVKDFSISYVDPQKEIEEFAAEHAPQPSKRAPGGPPDSYHDPSMDTGFYDSGYGTSQGAGFEKTCEDFIATYTPGGGENSKAEQILRRLVPMAQTNILAHNPRGQSGSYGGGYSGYDDPSMYESSPRPSSSPSGGGAQRQRRSLKIGNETPPSANRNQPTREIIDESLRKRVAFILREMMQNRGTKNASLLISAYCAFEPTDYVPEVAQFIEETVGSMKDLECFKDLGIEKDYKEDPRVQFLVCSMNVIVAKNSSLESKMLDYYVPVPGASRFVVEGLRSEQLRTRTLHILYEIGDADSAVEVAALLKDKSLDANYQKAILEVLAESGDGRVAGPLCTLLLDREMKEDAKAALIRIGSPAETALLSAFKRENTDLHLLVMEILNRIGTWKSLQVLSGQLKIYAEAKTDAELRSSEEKPVVQMELSLRNELLMKTLETGCMIISRMTQSPVPAFASKSVSRSSMSGSIPRGYASSPEDYGGDPSMIGGGYSSSPYPGSGGKPAVDPTGPRVLFTSRDVPPGRAPLFWVRELAAASKIKTDEMYRILSKAVNYESGRKAGEAFTDYYWVRTYFQQAGSQFRDSCLSELQANEKKSAESSLSNIANHFKRVGAEMSRVQKSSRTFNGYQETYRPPTARQNTPGGATPGEMY